MRICQDCGHLNTRPNEPDKNDIWKCIHCGGNVYSSYNMNSHWMFEDRKRAFDPELQFKMEGQ